MISKNVEKMGQNTKQTKITDFINDTEKGSFNYNNVYKSAKDSKQPINKGDLSQSVDSRVDNKATIDRANANAGSSYNNAINQQSNQPNQSNLNSNSQSSNNKTQSVSGTQTKSSNLSNQAKNLSELLGTPEPYGGLNSVLGSNNYKGLEALIYRAAGNDILGLKGYGNVKDNNNYKIVFKPEGAYGTNSISRGLRGFLTSFGEKSYASKELLEMNRKFLSLFAKYFPELYSNIKVQVNRRGNEYKLIASNGGYVKVTFKPANDLTPTLAWFTGDTLTIEGKNAPPELTAAILYLLSPTQEAAKDIGTHVAKTGINYMPKESSVYQYFANNYGQRGQS